MKLTTGVPLILRLVLGGLLVLSGSMKLGVYKHLGITTLAMDPLDFAFALGGFKLGLPEMLTQVLTYAVPWGELLCGLLLVAGLWTRGAAIGVIVLMLAFAAGIASLMVRGIDVNCPCFGKLKLFCGDRPLGWCHLIRNTGFALMGVAIVVMGPGMAAVDLMLGRRAVPGSARRSGEPTL